MADTTFVDNQTVIEASWLNDVNTAVYTTLDLKAPVASPVFTGDATFGGDARVSRGAHIGNYTISHTDTGSTTTVFGNYSGGVYSGMMIDNTWDGTYNDDAIRFVTHDGGAASQDALTLSKSGDATFSGNVNLSGIPTSSAGLSSGDVWSNGGVLTIV